MFIKDGNWKDFPFLIQEKKNSFSLSNWKILKEKQNKKNIKTPSQILPQQLKTQVIWEKRLFGWAKKE